ncbi:putative non-specific lipid-transfer protein 14 [Euphorbia lathyris]|uniref:putative non-specific lipid-transfer protein 14 n=1 Tax=Euphorbia lathyris TaxID=212925 RepID=UPI00331345ED
MMVVMLVWFGGKVTTGEVECGTVNGFLSACSTFIAYGLPDPLPGSPCCDAMNHLYFIAESGDNRRSVCRCFMGVISSYHPNATAIATLPGLCGISLGFIVDPNTDCN